jgi:hypothetical protein
VDRDPESRAHATSVGFYFSAREKIKGCDAASGHCYYCGNEYLLFDQLFPEVRSVE